MEKVMKKTIVCAAALLIGVMVVPNLQARPTKRFDQKTQMCRLIGEGRLDWESEPWGTGGKKFQEVCKSCHSRDSDKGAPFIHAQSYTSKGWNTIFANRRVKCARDGSWGALSEEDIQFINDYLYRNAAWTYDPNSSDSC
jgi:hypothetical protein